RPGRRDACRSTDRQNRRQKPTEDAAATEPFWQIGQRASLRSPSREDPRVIWAATHGYGDGRGRSGYSGGILLGGLRPRHPDASPRAPPAGSDRPAAPPGRVTGPSVIASARPAGAVPAPTARSLPPGTTG